MASVVRRSVWTFSSGSFRRAQVVAVNLPGRRTARRRQILNHLSEELRHKRDEVAMLARSSELQQIRRLERTDDWSAHERIAGGPLVLELIAKIELDLAKLIAANNPEVADQVAGCAEALSDILRAIRPIV